MKKHAVGKEVWAYCRVSTQKEEQELSLSDQVNWAREFVTLHGGTLRVFQERASAKTIIARPQCVRMIEEIEHGARPAILIATSFDRLSRDMTDTLVLARSLRKAGVDLYIRDRGIVPMDSFADQAALVGQAMGGHAENEARSNRAKASWARRRAEGKPTSNKVPYGLQLRSERDVEAPESGEWVRRAFTWYLSGDGMLTIAKRMQAHAPTHITITKKLDSEGKPIYRERRPVWECNRVKKMLVQRRYRGALIDEQTFDRVQIMLAQTPRWRSDRKFEYPFSGAIKCGGCHRSFHGHATGGYTCKDGGTALRRVRYYACTVCHYMLNAQRLEDDFRSQTLALVANKPLLDAWVSSNAPMGAPRARAKEIRETERRLESGEADKKRARIWTLALNNETFVSADLNRVLEQIATEEAALRDRLALLRAEEASTVEVRRTREQARSLLQRFWNLFDQASYDQQRELACALTLALGGVTATRDGIKWHGGPLAS